MTVLVELRAPGGLEGNADAGFAGCESSHGTIRVARVSAPVSAAEGGVRVQ